MGAGQYRHQVTIQTVTFVSDGAGGQTESVATYATWRMAAEPLESDEQERGAQLQARAKYRLRGPYVSGVTSDMQVVWGSRTFKIAGVTNRDERSRQLVLTVEELR